MRKAFCLILCLLLCASMLTVPVFADATDLTISNPEEFLAFAENCRLDSYSKDLKVTLAADIDLSGTDFQGVPIFYGSFEGNGHTVSGVHITAHGSNTGFFRYVAQGAVVSGLQVNGTVTPGGRADCAGGIAGSNAGQILECVFSGEVSGTDSIGGIAGTNSGIIDGSSIDATVSGNHFAGGIVGTNTGVIRNCLSEGSVNTSEKQNKVNISDITINTLTDTESSVTVTDIGGIAGTSSGVIRGCENRADVGYLHMSYNIGGIAGSQTGFLTACTNMGTVHGRKDVGGIVGHLEPNTTLIFEEDTLQILSGQLDTLAALTEKAGSHADSTSTTLSAQLTLLDGQVADAKNAADRLLPEGDELPDLDSILAAGNALGSSLTQISGTLGTIATETEDGAQTLVGDMDAIAKQMDAIEKTLQSGKENINADIADISDLDTEDDTAGKVSHCMNHGTVQGDWNTGGIVGIIGFETDLDPEADLDISGHLSLNQACDIRAVIRDCSNTASVTGKKQNTGGIIGTMHLGLIRECTNTGTITADAGDYTGGIAGRATAGYIRSCFAKATVTGAFRTGGIAGSSPVVSDCRSTVRLTGNEAVGAILGHTDDLTQIIGNYYLAAGKDPGGVDGISYAGCAQSLALEQFLSLENLPALFQTNTVTFCFADGTVETLTVPQGSNPDAEQIPPLPMQGGTEGTWVGRDGAVLENIEFDSVFDATYATLPTTLESAVLRENGIPVFLVQGSFPAGSILSAEAISMEACLEAWQLNLPDGTAQLRYLLPVGCDGDSVLLRLQGADGQWRDAAFTVQGSYLVFSAQNGDTALQLVAAPRDYTLLIVMIAGVLVLAGGITATLVHIRRKKKK